MKKFITLLFILISVLTTLSAQIPNKFKLTEDFFSYGTDFTSDNITIKEEHMTISNNFILSVNGSKKAVAKQKVFSYKTVINIYDGNDNKIGHVDETLTVSMFKTYSKYDIYDKNDKKVAYSEKHNYMSTSFIIKNLKGNTICTIKRPSVNIGGDEWDIEYNSNTCDKRLLIFIPCYKTYYDNK